MSAVAHKNLPVEQDGYPPEGSPRLWTRDEYYQLADAGILGPEERLELIEGEIVKRMSPIGTPQATAIVKATQVLNRIFEAGNTIRCQLPITLSDRSEPEPDILVARGSVDDYADHHPAATDVVLLVEVSDAMLKFDRGRKGRIYARAGIEDYWIIDLIGRCLEVHRKPSLNGYRSAEIYTEQQSVAPLASPDQVVQVVDLLPPSRSGQT